MVTWPLSESISDATTAVPNGHSNMHVLDRQSLNELNTRGPAALTSFTPTLTADTTSPTLGSGSISAGYAVQNGKWVNGTFSIRFGSSGRNAGSGIYIVALPYTAKGRGYTGGMTSDPVGYGKIWGGQSALDLAGGAHKTVTFHTYNGDNTKCLMVLDAGNVGVRSYYRQATAGQSSVGTSATDLKYDGTNAFNIQTSVLTTGSRWKIRASIPVAHETTADKYIWLDILKGSTVIGRASVTPHVVTDGISTGVEMARVEVIDDNPSAGSHTYKLQLRTESGTCRMVCGTSPNTWTPIFIAEEMLTEPAGHDYVADNNPWDWDAAAGQAEIWGVLSYEAA